MNIRLFSVVMIFALLPTGALAQRYCMGCALLAEKSMANQIADSQHFLVVKSVKTDNKDASAFHIVHAIRTLKNQYLAGDTIEMENVETDLSKAAPDQLYLLVTGDDKEGWFDPEPATPELSDYLKLIPADITADGREAERVSFFFQYLEHSTTEIAEDAFDEIQSASLESLFAAREQIPLKKIRLWLRDPDVEVTRLGRYMLLLGFCGDSQDADFLEQKILEPTIEFRPGIDSAMTSLLLLTGERGLDLLDKHKFTPTTFTDAAGQEQRLPFSETYGAMRAIRFIWYERPGTISRERLKRSMRILLDRPALADLVIADLARWQDWEIRSDVLARYGATDFDIPPVKRAVIRYFHFCAKEKRKDGTRPPHAIEADTVLKDLQQRDPKFYKHATRFLIR